jgi:hypothetical protein
MCACLLLHRWQRPPSRARSSRPATRGWCGRRSLLQELLDCGETKLLLLPTPHITILLARIYTSLHGRLDQGDPIRKPQAGVHTSTLIPFVLMTYVYKWRSLISEAAFQLMSSAHSNRKSLETALAEFN